MPPRAQCHLSPADCKASNARRCNRNRIASIAARSVSAKAEKAAKDEAETKRAWMEEYGQRTFREHEAKCREARAAAQIRRDDEQLTHFAQVAGGARFDLPDGSLYFTDPTDVHALIWHDAPPEEQMRQWHTVRGQSTVTATVHMHHRVGTLIFLPRSTGSTVGLGNIRIVLRDFLCDHLKRAQPRWTVATMMLRNKIKRAALAELTELLGIPQLALICADYYH